jgi:hypothetical protein
MLGAVSWRVWLWAQGKPFLWPQSIPFVITAALMVVVIYWLTPTLAGEAGIKSFTSWGSRKLFPWDQVVSAAIERQYLLQPSIKLSDPAGQAIWIPLDTKNLAGLHAVSLRFGGPEHPLTKVLETPLHAFR